MSPLRPWPVGGGGRLRASRSSSCSLSVAGFLRRWGAPSRGPGFSPCLYGRGNPFYFRCRWRPVSGRGLPSLSDVGRCPSCSGVLPGNDRGGGPRPLPSPLLSSTAGSSAVPPSALALVPSFFFFAAVSSSTPASSPAMEAAGVGHVPSLPFLGPPPSRWPPPPEAPSPLLLRRPSVAAAVWTWISLVLLHLHRVLVV